MEDGPYILNFTVRNSAIAAKGLGGLTKGAVGKIGAVSIAIQGTQTYGHIASTFSSNSLATYQKYILAGGEVVEAVSILGLSAAGGAFGGSLGALAGPGGAIAGIFIGGTLAGAGAESMGDYLLNNLRENLIKGNLNRASAIRFRG